MLVGASALALGLSSHPVHAYQDSAATISRPGADIVDTYFFPSPSNSQNVVAVMTVHPLIPAGQGGKTFFDQHVLYQMKFDNKVSEVGHTIPVEDLVIQFSVGPVTDGAQQIFMYGPAAPAQVGTTNTLITQSTSGIVGKSFSYGAITVRTGGPTSQAFADPTFYDRTQLLKIFPDRNRGSTAPSCLQQGCPNGFNNPGSNSQLDTNVLAIVVEMPRTSLIGFAGNTRVAYWATTSTETGS